MASVIIRQQDVKRLGKELLNEMFEFLHDEYILTEFKEMKEVQKTFLRNLVLNQFRYLNTTSISKRGILEILIEPFDENRFEYELNCVKDAMKNGSISTYVIFKTLNDLDFDMEINEDLYYKENAFLNIYNVFEGEYTYLKD